MRRAVWRRDHARTTPSPTPRHPTDRLFAWMQNGRYHNIFWISNASIYKQQQFSNVPRRTPHPTPGVLCFCFPFFCSVFLSFFERINLTVLLVELCGSQVSYPRH